MPSSNTMKLNFVESMDEVLKIALERELVALPMPPGPNVESQPVGETGRIKQAEAQRTPRTDAAPQWLMSS